MYKPKQDKIVSSICDMKLVEWGCSDYLAHVMDVDMDGPSTRFIHIKYEFSKLFPNDLSRMPPDRDIHFYINLESITHPISIPPYRMALTELTKLKTQIIELLDKGFIHPSPSHVVL